MSIKKDCTTAEDKGYAMMGDNTRYDGGEKRIVDFIL
jgi:hypothetical protein